MLTYLSITPLGVGYGAFFLVIGIVVPQSYNSGWSCVWLGVAQFFAAAGWKKISVIHYLHSLAPVPVNEGPFCNAGGADARMDIGPRLVIGDRAAGLAASLQIRRMQIATAGMSVVAFSSSTCAALLASDLQSPGSRKRQV